MDALSVHQQSACRQSALYRAVFSAIVGSVIEGFDFIAYGMAAALVFNQQFFPALNPATATLAAFGAFATGLFARPLGGMLFGHFGDRLGRKTTLMVSLLAMGCATVCIGLVPNYATIGMWSAVLLVLLRVIQGIALGGEMGGAVLIAVEHAPAHRKALFGSLPQIGPPIGLLLSTAAFSAVSRLPEHSFYTWGWRLPFLASIVLVALGYFVRRRVEESPEFANVASRRKVKTLPLRTLLAEHKKALLLAIGAKLPEVTFYYIATVFIVSYASHRLGLQRADVLQAVMLGAAAQIVALPLFGWLADRVGVRRLYLCGALLMAVCVVPLLSWLDGGSVLALKWVIAIGLGVNYALMFGPQSALFAAQFPVELRYSGISIGIQFAAAIGGGLAPLVATSLVASHGNLQPVAWYIAALALLASLCTFLMKRDAPRPAERAVTQPEPTVSS